MVIVQKIIQFMSSLGVIGIAAPVNCFVTSLPQTETLAARYEQTMARLEQITRAGYKVKVQWEYAFDDAGEAKPELLAHSTVCNSPLCTRGALYGGRTEAMRLQYKAREGETIQYVDGMRLYPYM